VRLVATGEVLFEDSLRARVLERLDDAPQDERKA
jgi:hypothetical protein